MSRNLHTESCPECDHDWPTLEEMSGRPVEFRQYEHGDAGDPVIPGIPWRCPNCQTLYFLWLSYGWAPGTRFGDAMPAQQRLPADASYYGSYNDEPGGSESNPRHLAVPLRAEQDREIDDHTLASAESEIQTLRRLVGQLVPIARTDADQQPVEEALRLIERWNDHNDTLAGSDR